MPSPANDYHGIIDSFKARLLTEKDIEKRLSDLMLLFDFSASLTRTGDLNGIADLLLLTLMGYTASRRGVFLRSTRDGLECIAFRGYRGRPLAGKLPLQPEAPYRDYYTMEHAAGPWREIGSELELSLILPLCRDEKLLGIVGVGGPAGARTYSVHELEMIGALAQMCVLSIQNAETNQMLESLNRQLILKVYQLNSLFELAKDFNALFDSESIFRVLGSSLIGQLLVSRVAVFTFPAGCPVLRFSRGFRFEESEIGFLQQCDILECFPDKQKPLLCSECEKPGLGEFYERHKVNTIFPVVLNDEIRGILFLGERKNRKPFTQEDADFVITLGNLALVSEENVRNQQQIIEKQRLERELTIAREIQHSLLPQSIPDLPGYEIATAFEPAYQVGGDYFDVIQVSDSEVALAIGDVSGKGTPAAMIMASVQASLRTLAALQISDPKITIQRLNELLCRSQGSSNKYVTFFYAVLNHATHQMSYVNAGHCYPLILKQNGRVDRLETGGMVMGFFPEVVYRSGNYSLDPGDVVVMYTDGVSELIDAREEEFGVERIIEALQCRQDAEVVELRKKLVKELDAHKGEQKQSDDLTLILLKRK